LDELFEIGGKNAGPETRWETMPFIEGLIGFSFDVSHEFCQVIFTLLLLFKPHDP